MVQNRKTHIQSPRAVKYAIIEVIYSNEVPGKFPSQKNSDDTLFLVVQIAHGCINNKDNQSQLVNQITTTTTKITIQREKYEMIEIGKRIVIFRQANPQLANRKLSRK